MSLLFRLEKWLENQVERFFGPREGVQPIEIARRMVRAMEDQARISVRCTYVPNSFMVYVCKEDLTELESIMNTLGQDLASHVKAAAQRQSFAFPGPVTVQFAAEVGLNRGETRIVAHFVESDETPESDQASEESAPSMSEIGEVISGGTGRFQPQQAASEASSGAVNMESTQFYKTNRRIIAAWRLVVDEGPDAGAEFTVRMPASIGRRQGCDVQLHDPKVSRLHARVEQTPEGAVLFDADSTNGMRVNGRLVQKAVITAGDKIELGATRLTIKPVGSE